MLTAHCATLNVNAFAAHHSLLYICNTSDISALLTACHLILTTILTTSILHHLILTTSSAMPTTEYTLPLPYACFPSAFAADACRSAKGASKGQARVSTRVGRVERKGGHLTLRRDCWPCLEQTRWSAACRGPATRQDSSPPSSPQPPPHHHAILSLPGNCERVSAKPRRKDRSQRTANK